MLKYIDNTDDELLEDLKKMSNLTKKAMYDNDYEITMLIKQELHSKDDELKLRKYDDVGTKVFQIYRDAISEASAKSGGRWYKNASSTYDKYTYKLDEIRIELNDRINFLES